MIKPSLIFMQTFIVGLGATDKIFAVSFSPVTKWEAKDFMSDFSFIYLLSS